MAECQILTPLCADCGCNKQGLSDALCMPRPIERVMVREVVQFNDGCAVPCDCEESENSDGS